MDRVRQRAALVASRIWLSLPHYTEDVIPQWYEEIRPVVIGATFATVQVADAFFAASLQDRVTGIDPSAAVAKGAGKDFEDLYRQPFMRTWHHVNIGTPFPEAVRHGGDHLRGLVTEDIGRAELGATQLAIEDRDYVQAYRRVVSGARTCNFCYDVAGNTYSSADLAPLHAHCDCGVELLPDREYVKSYPGSAARNVGERIDRDGNVVTKLSKEEEAARKKLPPLSE
jgi:hypothetical protein